jgi:hypothetical protein
MIVAAFEVGGAIGSHHANNRAPVCALHPSMMEIFNRLRLTHRVLAVIAGYLAVLALVVTMGLWGMYQAKESLRDIHEHRMEVAEAMATLLRNYYDSRLQLCIVLSVNSILPVLSCAGSVGA